jgi:hypothetical protein
VRFALHGDPAAGETVWAQPTGDDHYRLHSAPFYAHGYAEGDVVRCIRRDGWPEVVDLVHDSGNGTLRLLFATADGADAWRVLDELVSVGCTYERASARLVAVTVPPSLQLPFSQVANYLNGLSSDLLSGWDVGKVLTRGSQHHA